MFEFQPRNTLNHYILIFLKGGVIDEVNTIYGIISTALPTSEQGRDLGKVVKTFSIHHQSCTDLEGLETQMSVLEGMKWDYSPYLYQQNVN